MDIGDVLADAAKGAAAGAIAGPIGAAVGGIGGLILSIAPSIGTYLFGPDPQKAQEVAAAVATAVTQVTGTSDAEGAVAAMAANPALKGQLQVALATIAAQRAAADRASDVAMLQASVADMANARTAQMASVQKGGLIAWNQPVLGWIIVGAFFAILLAAFAKAGSFSAADEFTKSIIWIAVGNLMAAFTAVVTFNFGSSVGSVDKSAQLEKARQQQHDTIQTLLPPISQPVPLE